MCGLYQSTSPPTPSSNAGGSESVPTAPPTDTATGGSSTQTVQDFLSNFGSQIAAGNVGTVLTLICHASANDPDPAAADSPVESWALAHAHVQPVLPADTSGGPGIASVRMQVSPSIRPTHLQRDPWTSDSRVWQGCSGRSSSTVVAVIAPIGTRRPVRRIPERQLWLIAAGRAPWPPSQLVTFSLRVSRLLAASSGVPSA